MAVYQQHKKHCEKMFVQNYRETKTLKDFTTNSGIVLVYMISEGSCFISTSSSLGVNLTIVAKHENKFDCARALVQQETISSLAFPMLDINKCLSAKFCKDINSGRTTLDLLHIHILQDKLCCIQAIAMNKSDNQSYILCETDPILVLPC